jgi:predicted RNA-binding Zn-ribbon protein involved in translation (DUF1610 family)
MDDKLLTAYERMLARIKKLPEITKPLFERVELAKEQALELGELSREDAERLAYYVKRDLHDAADFLLETEHELADWLRFDISLLEQRWLDLFSIMEDSTRTELDNLARQASLESEWMSGEITCAGTLYCASCGHELQFLVTSFIPACPNCGATLFVRSLD